MHPHARAVRASLAAALVTLICATHAHAVALDAFTSAFPPNPCLPVSGAPVIFVGPYCDAAACPPATPVNCEDGAGAEQALGLPGVMLGFIRNVGVSSSAPEDQVSARIEPALQQIQVSASTLYNHQLNFMYAPSGVGHFVDFPALGLAALQFNITGTVSPAHPLHCKVTMTSEDPLLGTAGSADAILLIDSPGLVSMPLSTLAAPGFSLSTVRWIFIAFDDCDPITGCTDANPFTRSYALGPLTFSAGAPTTTRRASWSSLKAHYR